MQSPHPSPSDENEDEALGSLDSGWHVQDRHGIDSKTNSPEGEEASVDQPTKPPGPMQKRRRVTRACDECRRKKIKCDGKQPCTHCTVYSYECTYDQPSNRRRNPAPQYTEALENRLQKAEAILRAVLPGIDLDDPKFDARGIDQIIESESRKSAVAASAKKARAEDDAQLQSMVENTGSLDLDDQGHWDFHGHSSGFAFMRKLRTQFGDLTVPDPRMPAGRSRQLSQMLESPKSMASSPFDITMPSSFDLPSRELARQLCRNTLDDAIALMRFIHQPSFYRNLDRIFDTDSDHFTNDDVRFLPLLYVVMAIGCLFAQKENSMLDVNGYESAMEQGYQYFRAGRQMLDITDCRDLTTLQTVAFMIIFLQSTAKLSTCYAYLGIALRACCRLGLHRHVINDFNPIEREERKRVFWLIRRMDAYVGAMLGLPNMLSGEDIDQQFPEEIDDEFITVDGLLPMPPGRFPLIRASNAHTKLVCILLKVVRHIYPIKGLNDIAQKGPAAGYSISHSRIRELERDLQIWMDELPMELRPTEEASRDLSRVQQLLRISYAHVQMMLYRPFLHYVSHNCESKGVDKRSFACAAACVSVARNIVHITAEMKRRGLLIGAYWFVMYTTYLAILALVFFVVENPDSPTGRDILKDAMEGKDTLASLAKRSFAADRCSQSLAGLFTGLPDMLHGRKSSLSSPSAAQTSRKRPPSTEPASVKGNENAPEISTLSTSSDISTDPSRIGALPQTLTNKDSKRNSMPETVRRMSAGFEEDQMRQTPNQQKIWNLGNMPDAMTPSSSTTSFPGQQLGNPNLPDLKAMMFPSDNPFAYPNQPISTLEAQQITPDQQNSFPSPANSGIYSSGRDSTHTGTGISFENPSMPIFGDISGIQPSFLQQPGQFGVSMSSGPTFEIPQQMEGNGEVGGLNLPGEGYWTQMDRAETGRTGLTPGGINLDELFGGEGWSSIWGDPSFGKP